MKLGVVYYFTHRVIAKATVHNSNFTAKLDLSFFPYIYMVPAKSSLK